LSYNPLIKTACLITFSLQSHHKNGLSCHTLLTAISQDEAHLYDVNMRGLCGMLPLFEEQSISKQPEKDLQTLLGYLVVVFLAHLRYTCYRSGKETLLYCSHGSEAAYEDDVRSIPCLE